eukprot:gb/GECH01011202.1/.p1 GENE.gb/GECH01011202.1/~~gb/GECH01011202.1/.p1  ORF type:complete len:195 (+),score=19.36 gb/GECH01011202.1/:1-585(+)
MSRTRRTVTKEYRLNRTTAIKRYFIAGRMIPSQKYPTTSIYKMTIFARNEVQAKSRFWYFLRRMKKVKKANGEILAVRQLQEESPLVVKNFGIWFRYNSSTGVHNMYKEFRDTTITNAVAQLYADMAGRHHAGYNRIQLIKISTVSGSKAIKPITSTFSDPNVKFPIPHRKPRVRKINRKAFVSKKSVPSTAGW